MNMTKYLLIAAVCLLCGPLVASASVDCEVDADCYDGNPCTNEFCDLDLGFCVFEPISCDDGDACTSDYCDPFAGCVHESEACGCGLEVRKTCQVLGNGSTGDDCQGKLVEAVFRYTGAGCSASNHTQSGEACSGGAEFAEAVRILAHKGKEGGPVWGDQSDIQIGGRFKMSAAFAGQENLAGGGSIVEIFAEDGRLIESLEIHTSCSQPLNVGDRFGSLTLVGMESTDGGSIGESSGAAASDVMCEIAGLEGAEVVYSYEITNSGSVEITDVVVYDDVLGEVPGSPIEVLEVGETVILTTSAMITETTTNLVTVSGDAEGQEVACADEVTVAVVPAPQDCCSADGKPSGLVMQYTGESCTAGSNSHSAGKVLCDGDPEFEPMVRIVSNDKPEPDDDGGRVWFDGLVALDEVFEVDTHNAGETKLKGDTWIHVLDVMDNPLQTIKLHTSCSQPMVTDDRFGSVLLVGCLAQSDDSDSGFCAEGGKPESMTLRYSGADCDASSHSQKPNKVLCDGDPQYAAEVYIVVNEKKKPGKGKIWFEGAVLLEEVFEISARNADKKKLKSKTYVHILDEPGGVRLQMIAWHTSCSQPLVAGDVFGAVTLLDMERAD